MLVSVAGIGMKEWDLGLGWGYRPWGVGLQHSKVSVPLSPRTDAVFQLRVTTGGSPRNLGGNKQLGSGLEAPALVEAVTVRLDAQLRPPRDVREGPLHRPLMLFLHVVV